MKLLMSICTTLALGLAPAVGTTTPLGELDLTTPKRESAHSDHCQWQSNLGRQCGESMRLYTAI